MSQATGWRARRRRFLDRYHAWAATRSRPATGFVSHPEPRSIGRVARGRQLCAGNLMFAGHHVEAPGQSPWALTPPDASFAEELHGFTWLDDLAAAGDRDARATAQAWLWDWIARYGRGRGPGWTPDLTGRRVIRWISHAIFLLQGQDAQAQAAFFRVLAGQTAFLGRRWASAPEGLPRFEALTGLLQASLSLTGMEPHRAPALAGLDRECRTRIDPQGGIPSRNPEALMEVLALLTWASEALREVHRTPTPELEAAIARIVPVLRALRHADGGLARFHGGGRGAEGRLDRALAAAGTRRRPLEGLAMGYARLSAGRTSLIVDAAPPPSGRQATEAHASTLAFELTSGRRPLIVNCGSGESFGSEWRRASRATASHSTLALEGYSSARFGKPGQGAAAERPPLHDIPRQVPVQVTRTEAGSRFEGGHDGYVSTHGLTHARILELGLDGRGLAGEDMLLAMEDLHKRRFDKALDAARLQGLAYSIRFHLHPDADAELDLGGSAVSVALRSGEIWVFRHDGAATLTLEPSVYLENGRLRPRATQQIVLSGRAMEYATRIRWSLAKAQDTPVALRDLAEDKDVETVF
ncbi:MAG: heparinase II/III family protein [Paracoccaceae bacterium]